MSCKCYEVDNDATYPSRHVNSLMLHISNSSMTRADLGLPHPATPRHRAAQHPHISHRYINPNCPILPLKKTYMHLPRPFTRAFRTSTALARCSIRPRSPTNTPLAHLFSARMSSSMAQRLKGKTIVITGASSGIGRSTAVEFARTQPDDLKLILTARREETLKEVAKEIEGFAKGVKVLPVKLDVSDVSAVEGFVGNLPEEWKEIDVLVNNACVQHTYPSRTSFLTDYTAD